MEDFKIAGCESMIVPIYTIHILGGNNYDRKRNGFM